MNESKEISLEWIGLNEKKKQPLNRTEMKKKKSEVVEDVFTETDEVKL